LAPLVTPPKGTFWAILSKIEGGHYKIVSKWHGMTLKLNDVKKWGKNIDETTKCIDAQHWTNKF